ncbi:pancreatic lipase-related protein 2-like [Argiope bruennichi]|uniref:Inactive pancreatic lipase-related protein 1 like protein n=1 Tax=Argiope bruennichi TaxID=94029 RepID=A0A8T0F6X9_ARGBR|nr:pancreatic lipase-related protein 2-like [Argiope bruennichi]KAF8786162.1 Inactive pancreatic lipase-related protein 1 like protein [Argiope bruennichi]
MANRSTLIISIIFIAVLLFPESDAGLINSAISTFISGAEYFLKSATSIIKEIINPPRNSNSSIQYALFTPDSPQEPCYLEQNKEALERCPFNSTYPLKILIHGFLVENPPLFDMKNKMLELYKYNVILMDWTRYNQPPYLLSAINTLVIGHELANFIQFLENTKGVDPKNVHLIGHSLGAHVSGVAGKETPNLGRISGLDPAFPLFSSKSILHRLTYTDADFVDVIHTSTSLLGFGIGDPIGHQDFYPNGGSEQPECVADKDSEILKYDETREGENLDGSIRIDVNVCDHSAASMFYMESINPAECIFLSVMCDSYKDFQAGICSNSSNLLTKMGLPAKPIPGLGPTTEFYLRTGEKAPYCLEDGYEPE